MASAVSAATRASGRAMTSPEAVGGACCMSPAPRWGGQRQAMIGREQAVTGQGGTISNPHTEHMSRRGQVPVVHERTHEPTCGSRKTRQQQPSKPRSASAPSALRCPTPRVPQRDPPLCPSSRQGDKNKTRVPLLGHPHDPLPGPFPSRPNRLLFLPQVFATRAPSDTRDDESKVLIARH